MISISDTPLNNKEAYENFKEQSPFPYLVLDNFLPLEIANKVINEIENFHNFQKSNDYVFAKNKFESPNIEIIGIHCDAIRNFFLSSEFADVLSSIYGKPLFVDPYFVGGGLHRGGVGSFLDMHADFNLHPINKSWIRELNILLYLNKNWLPEYGGALELRHATTNNFATIEPIFNRLVIMQTNDFTLHGYKRINFPENKFRTSIAAYAYSAAISKEAVTKMRSTTMWVPDGGVKSLIAPIVPALVSLKQRIFGSATGRKNKNI
jgi:Rps23 Pro-64 3,4-dihydroxylase Tpa1-like proline 4-hydroxylase